jgi:hypothetical protein
MSFLDRLINCLSSPRTDQIIKSKVEPCNERSTRLIPADASSVCVPCEWRYNGQRLFAFSPCFGSRADVELREKLFQCDAARYSGTDVSCLPFTLDILVTRVDNGAPPSIN